MNVTLFGIGGLLITLTVIFALLRSEEAFMRDKQQLNAPTRVSAENDWTYIGSSGGIESYVKKMEGSNVLAFRGVAYLDMHISQAMGPYMNISSAKEWVSMLSHIEQYPIDNHEHGKHHFYQDLVYQVWIIVLVLWRFSSLTKWLFICSVPTVDVEAAVASRA